MTLSHSFHKNSCFFSKTSSRFLTNFSLFGGSLSPEVCLLATVCTKVLATKSKSVFRCWPLLVHYKIEKPNNFMGLLPPLSLIDMLHASGGDFHTWWFPYLPVASMVWAVCLPELWSLPLVSFSLPFLGAFFLWCFWQGFIKTLVGQTLLTLDQFTQVIFFFNFLMLGHRLPPQEGFSIKWWQGFKPI